MDRLAPEFAVALGIPRDQLLDMSIPLMVDHVDYYNEMKGSGRG